MTWRPFPILRGPILLVLLAAACSPDSEPPQIDPIWRMHTGADCEPLLSRRGADLLRMRPARNGGVLTLRTPAKDRCS